ncbi:hypothetical protein J2S34_000553 [Nitrobacter winogradskyi]|uniref:Uncharacterized protein n=1 Tax=Nitrobacter winogradskyi TaxID=913 RepID=A0ACC6AFR4_NITWI|nr:hypothetical protein [Nitrobacter winogradskyi]
MGLRRISPRTDSVSLNISKSLNHSTHYAPNPGDVPIPPMFVGYPALSLSDFKALYQ